jgi:succinate dehydrogenase/fumarate reductase flavoprotein subunit
MAKNRKIIEKGPRLRRRTFLKGLAASAAGLAFGAERARAGATFDETADVIIVGFGGAGASAAIAARAAGASVLVLESAETGGGTTALAGGILYLGGGTGLQKALGYDDTTDGMFDYLMASSGPHPDERKVRTFCERSVEHYDWLLKLGVPFKASFYKGISLPLTDDGLLYSGSEKAWPFNEITKPVPRGHKPQATGDGGGALMMEHLIAGARKAGATVVAKTRAAGLLRGGDGRVIGVAAEGPDGTKRYGARRGVILTSGGFCRNREMMELYAPEYLGCDSPIGVAGDDGSGILMATAAGAAAIRMAACFTDMPFHPPEKLIEGILVNASGARFINEDVYYGESGNEIVRRQDGRAVLILDAGVDVESAYARPAKLGESDSIDDLEKTIGLPTGALTQTVAYYNRHAADGKDPLFRKQPEYLRPLDKPPFRALGVSTDQAYYPYFTLGGLHTNVDGEVLDGSGKAIRGLYAAGRTTSGVAALGYSSGVSISDATLFGRFAGESAAAATPHKA